MSTAPSADELARLTRRVEALEQQLAERSGALERELEAHGRTALALAEQKDSFQAFLDAITESAFLMTPEGIVLAANAAVAARLGTTRAELVGRNTFDYLAAEVADYRRTWLREVLQTGRPARFEDIRAGRCIENTVYPVLDASGAVARLVIIGADVTERQRVEATLREEKEFSQRLIASLPDGISVVDKHGANLEVNPALCRMTGFSREEIIAAGPPPHLYWPPERYDEIQAALQKTLSSEVTSFELVFMRKNRQRFPVLVSSATVMDSQGRVTSHIGIVRDITDRCQAEVQLRKTLAELARSNEELERFAYVASHDLQEPIRMIMVFSELLERRYVNQLEDQAREFIGFVTDAARRMHQMVADLLSYSRVGTQGQAATPVAVEDCVARALDNVQLVVEQTGAEVTVADLPTLMADDSQLVHLFQNLIGNALKFHGGLPPRIRIEAADLGDEWRIAVADQGIGLDPAFGERIFLIFQRLHSFSQYPGTGIGLAICKRIVERHGGRIWVESKPGKGATFLFTIPKELPPELREMIDPASGAR